MSWPVSARFREAVQGTHRSVSRALLLLPNAPSSVPQFGSAPVGGQELPILDGDVTLSATADVKGSLSITIPGDYWDLVQPYGAEVFAERGIDFGDGTREMVPLGYFRISRVSQDRSPYGPIRIDGDDRTAQLRQVRIVYPYQIPAGTTHRQLFTTLVNGNAPAPGAGAPSSSIATYGMYVGKTMTILWDRAGYNPDTAVVSTGAVVDDSVYDFLAKLVAEKGAVIRIRRTGEMSIERRDPDLTAPADFVLREGKTGTLVQASRSVDREGVFNMVRAIGSDPAHQTGYRLSYITDPNSPIRWDGPFGYSLRYYASPVLSTSAEADSAAETILARATGLPTEQSLWTIPDPSATPLDIATAIVGNLAPVNHVVDEVAIPLAGDNPVKIDTRTLNTVPVNPTDPEPDPGTIPDDPDPTDPTNPGGDPGGPTPGGGDPSDGTQVALTRGWGAVIAGDECVGTGRPPASKWGLYDGAGHDGNGRRVPSAWNYHDGILTIHGDQGGNTGGAAFRYSNYGYRCEIRARAYNTGPGSGSQYHFVLILWPDSDKWPEGAEYDFWEGNVGEPDADAFLHLPNHQPYRQDQASIKYNPKDWHNYACEWNPAAQTLKVWVDGVQVYDGKGRVAQAPGPMHLTAQLDNFGGSSHKEANMDIAWVRIYNRPNG
jgi:hypothetical protein